MFQLFNSTDVSAYPQKVNFHNNDKLEIHKMLWLYSHMHTPAQQKDTKNFLRIIS